MTSNERVIAALKNASHDRVPWIEGIVGNRIASLVCGETIEVDWSVAPDGFPKMAGRQLAEEQKKINRVLGKDNINFCAFAPVFCHKLQPADDGSPVLVGDGKIKCREDFDRLFKLPPVQDAAFIANARDFIRHKGDDCAIACIRLGIGCTLLSMGLEAFAYAMADDPQLIVDVHDAYADWTAAVAPILEDLGFDAFWAFDDVAFNSGPVFSPDFYRRHILPKERALTQKISKPLITHSDGNMLPLMDAWLELGQQAIHPLQPDVMDIHAVKAKYGQRVCLVGNISMADLVHKQPADIIELTRERIQTIGQGGGYILSSSNSLTDNMRPENVLAMREAVRKYGALGKMMVRK